MNRSFLGHAGRGRRFRLQAGTLRGGAPAGVPEARLRPRAPYTALLPHPCPCPSPERRPRFRTHARPISPAALYNKEQRRIPGHRLTFCLDVPRRANPVQAKSVRGGFLYCMDRPVSWKPGNSGIHGHGVSGHGGGKSGDLLPGIFPISRQDHLQQPIGQTGK